MASRRSFLILIGVTLVAVIAAMLVQRGDEEIPADYGLHAPDLAGKTGDVQTVAIRTATDELRLTRTEDGWRAVNRAGYPADAERIRRLVLGMSRLRRLERKTSDPARHPRLELADVSKAESRATRIDLLDAQGGTVAALLVGKTEDFQAAGRSRYFVRDPGEDQAWLVEGVLPPVLDEMRNWLEQDLLAGLEDKDLRRVTVRHAGGEVVTIIRDDPEADFTLADLDSGERIDSQHAVDAMVDTLRGLSLKDFSDPDAAGQSTPVAVVEALTFSGVRVAADIRRGKPDYLVQLSAMNEQDPVDGAEVTERLNRRWQDRWFVVSQYSLDALLVERADLIAEDGSPDAD